MKKTGAIIFIIGLLATVFTGLNFVTREKVVDIGEFEITADKNHSLAWKPFLGLCVMIVGGIVYASGSKRVNTTLILHQSSALKTSENKHHEKTNLTNIRNSLNTKY